MTTVRVYTKPDCPQCTLTKNLFTREGVAFVEEDATDPGNLAAIKALGFLSAPVVCVGESADDMWAGFKPERIREIADRIKNGEK